MVKKLPADFDWRSSPAHLYLLSYFLRPNDAHYVAGMSKWDYTELNEKAEGLSSDSLAKACCYHVRWMKAYRRYALLPN